MCVYQGVQNVSFSENSAYVLNDSFPILGCGESNRSNKQVYFIVSQVQKQVNLLQKST